jgi:hypothetical protein
MKIFRQPGGHDNRWGGGDVSATPSLGQAVMEDFLNFFLSTLLGMEFSDGG